MSYIILVFNNTWCCFPPIKRPLQLPSSYFVVVVGFLLTGEGVGVARVLGEELFEGVSTPVSGVAQEHAVLQEVG